MRFEEVTTPNQTGTMYLSFYLFLVRTPHTDAHPCWFAYRPPVSGCFPAPTSSLSFATVVFLRLTDWAGMRWNHTTHLICISFMTKDVENFSPTYWSFVLLWRPLCLIHMYLDWLDFFLLFLHLILCVLYALWIILPGQRPAGKHFSHFLVCSFVAVTTISAEEKLINLIKPSFSILVVMFWVTGAGQEVAAGIYVRNGCPMFASSGFQVPGLILSV